MAELTTGNYDALLWVQDELQKSLLLGQDALQQYIEQPEDTVALSNCVEQLYQTQGTFDLLNLQGAYLLASEMLALTTALRSPEQLDTAVAFDALVSCFLILPNHLKHIDRNFPDHPLTLLDSINHLRQLRQQPEYSVEAFLPQQSELNIPETVKYNAQRELPPIDINPQQLPHAFQHQLLQWLRHADDARLRKLRGLFRYLRLSHQTPEAITLWWTAEAFVETLIHRGLPAIPENKQLLGKLISPIKLTTHSNETQLVADYPIALLQALFLQIAHATSQGPTVSEVKTWFNLHFYAHQKQLYGLSDNALLNAHVALLAELRQLKDTIENFDLDDSEATTALDDISQQLLTLSGTFDLLDQPEHSTHLKQQSEALQELINQQFDNAPIILSTLADTLLRLENELAQSSGEKAALNVSAIHNVVIQECLIELINLKEELSLLSRQTAVVQLPHQRIHQALRQLIGSLDILGLETLANLLTKTLEKVATADTEHTHTALILEHLAEIISTSEFYLETIAKHGQASNKLLHSAYNTLSYFGQQPEVKPTPLSLTVESNDDGLETLPDSTYDESLAHQFEEAITLDIAEPIADTLPLENNVISTELLHALPDTHEVLASTSIDNSIANPIQFAEEVDDELANIFIEEAEELLTQLTKQIDAWQLGEDDSDLPEIRRALHTLKGSGRMAGARHIATLALELESVLNEVLDGFSLSRSALSNVLIPAVPVFRKLLRQFTNGQADSTADAIALQNQLQDIHSDDLSIAATETILIEADHSSEDHLTLLHEVDDVTLDNEDTVLSFSVPVIDIQPPSDTPDEVQLHIADEHDELMEIFLIEAHQHMETLQTVAAELKTEHVIDKRLLSAAHSLKGCANIAGVKPVAIIATELDKTFRELHRQQIALDTEQLQLLHQSINGLQNVLLSVQSLAEEPDLQQLNQKIQQLRPAPIADDAFVAIDPDKLVSFLEETDSLLDAYSQQLDDWRESANDNTQQALNDTLQTLSENAAHLDLSSLATVYQLLNQLISASRDHDDLLEKGYELLNEQIDALIQHKPAAPISDFEQAVHHALLDTPITSPNTSDNEVSTAAISRVERYIQNKFALQPTLTSVEKYIRKLTDAAPSSLTSVAQYLLKKHESIKPITSVEQYLRAQADKTESDLLNLSNIDHETDEIDTPFVSENDAVLLENTTAPDTLAIQTVTDVSAVDADLLEAFSEESAELLNSSQEAIQQWQATQSNGAMLQLQRDLHTLKGGARLAGVTAIADLSHHLESLLLDVIEPGQVINGPAFDLLQRCQDELSIMQECLVNGQPITSAQHLIESIQTLAPTEISADDEPVVIFAPPHPSTTSVSLDTRPLPIQNRAQPTQLTAGEQIRVRSDLLDYLSNFAGEVSISRDRVTQQHQTLHQHLAEMGDTIARLHEQLRKLEIETETQILFRYEDARADQNADFDPLELDRFSTIQQLSRSLTESLTDMNEISQAMNELVRETDVLLLQQSRVNTDLQQGLMDTRLLPFSHIVPRLERIVRQASTETGKLANLTVHGANREIDRAILDRLVAPLEHVLRNAIAHGIESPEERIAKQKAEIGQLHIQLLREGSEIVLILQDDGKGLDIEKIRQKALSLGLITADRMPTDEALMQLILSSGFSTAENISQLAGRGVGLDVVNNEIRALKGRLFIQSTPQEGATFTIRLPLTLSLIQALLVSAHNTQYAIPLSTVTAGERIATGTIRSLLSTSKPQYQFDGEQYDFIPLSHLLGQPLSLPQDLRQPLPLLLYRSGNTRVALLVNAIHSNREIVIKPVGQQLAHINALNGATILGDGRIVLILDVTTLIEQYKAQDLAQSTVEMASAIQHLQRDKPVALVVDDSITMRKASTNLLLRHDFEVTTAKDGVEALAQIHEKLPDIILLDIEMPRMDGFEFASIVRNDSRFKHLPIIMITSRTGEKHRQRAFDIGVNDYLGKPYQEDEIIASISRLLTSSPSLMHS